MRIAVPLPSGPFWERSASRSLKPGARLVRGPALSPGRLLNVLGRLIVVLVASSVPVIAGCGRPESGKELSADCVLCASVVLPSDCAVVRSMSLITEFKLVCSTCGLSGSTSFVSSGMAAVARTSCKSLSNDFLSSGSWTSVLSGLGLAASDHVGRGRFFEWFGLEIDLFHLESRRLSFFHSERGGRLKAGAIKGEAEKPMQGERERQAQTRAQLRGLFRPAQTGSGAGMRAVTASIAS